eukprot:1739047-Rhodomonas_salina.1
MHQTRSGSAVHALRENRNRVSRNNELFHELNLTGPCSMECRSARPWNTATLSDPNAGELSTPFHTPHSFSRIITPPPNLVPLLEYCMYPAVTSQALTSRPLVTSRGTYIGHSVRTAREGRDQRCTHGLRQIPPPPPPPPLLGFPRYRHAHTGPPSYGSPTRSPDPGTSPLPRQPRGHVPDAAKSNALQPRSWYTLYWKGGFLALISRRASLNHLRRRAVLRRTMCGGSEELGFRVVGCRLRSRVRSMLISMPGYSSRVLGLGYSGAAVVFGLLVAPTKELVFQLLDEFQRLARVRVRVLLLILEGLGFRVQGSGFRVQGLGFR